MRKEKEQARYLIGDVPVFCVYDEIVKIEKLNPNPKNPNFHPQEQLKLLANVIKKTGVRSPITVSKLSGLIVKGHGRLEAAKLAGMEEYPVEYQAFADEDEEIAALLADNKIAEFSEIDSNLLQELFEDFNMDNLEITGFTQEDLQCYFEDIEEEDLPEDIPLDKEKADSTRQDFLAYGNTKIILTQQEKVRFDALLKNYGDKNGNLFGFIAEILENGAKNYEN